MKVLKFSSPSCAPCKRLDEYLKSISVPGLEVESLNMMNDMEIFSQYGVRNVPTVIEINENREEIKRWVGKESFIFYLTNLKSEDNE